jgi:hypothetical protein
MKSDFFVRTTLNIEESQLNELRKRCEEKDMSLSVVIKKAVKLYIDVTQKGESKWHSVSYQQKGRKYKKLHFSMTTIEYDTYIDLRKLNRLSFSYIVALALQMFLDEIFSEEPKDSYPLLSYGKFCIKKNNCTFHVFSWGIPLEPVTLTIVDD